MPDITYCSRLSCAKKSCPFHQYHAPCGVNISMANRDNGCYRSMDDHKALRKAICIDTQKTALKCDDVCKSMCSSNGDCAYCAILAETIEDETLSFA